MGLQQQQTHTHTRACGQRRPHELKATGVMGGQEKAGPTKEDKEAEAYVPHTKVKKRCVLQFKHAFAGT